IGRLQSTVDSCDFNSCGFNTRVVAQACYCVTGKTFPAQAGRARERHPDVLVIHEHKAFRQHANHSRWDVVDPNGCSDDVRTPAKSALPEVITDDRDWWRRRIFVAGSKVSAEHRLHADQAKGVGSDATHGHVD